MSKTTVDIDPELLAAAKARLGTNTIKETINAALSEIAQRGEREEAIDDLANMVSESDLDWEILYDKDEYRPALAEHSAEDSAPSPTKARGRTQGYLRGSDLFRGRDRAVRKLTQPPTSRPDLTLPFRLPLPVPEGMHIFEFKSAATSPRSAIQLKHLLNSLDLHALADLRDRLGSIRWVATDAHHMNDEPLHTVDEARLLLDELVAAATSATPETYYIENRGDAE